MYEINGDVDWGDDISGDKDSSMPMNGGIVSCSSFLICNSKQELLKPMISTIIH